MNDEPFGMRDLFGSVTVRIALTGVLAILALFLLAQTIVSVTGLTDPTTPPAKVITVNGSGRAVAVPDIAKIDFSVTETSKAVADAQSATTKRANAALAAIKEAGIADKDVRTLSYNVSPQYTYPQCPAADTRISYCPSTPTITGYQVSETVEVTVHDLTKTGDILQKLGTLGVQNISGPQFTVDDDAAVQSQARADAINKAKTDAVRLADELGVHLGKIVSFSESNGGMPYPVYAKTMSAGAAMDSSVAPSLPTGQNEYTANVSITYEIR